MNQEYCGNIELTYPHLLPQSSACSSQPDVHKNSWIRTWREPRDNCNQPWSSELLWLHQSPTGSLHGLKIRHRCWRFLQATNTYSKTLVGSHDCIVASRQKNHNHRLNELLQKMHGRSCWLIGQVNRRRGDWRKLSTGHRICRVVKPIISISLLVPNSS